MRKIREKRKVLMLISLSWESKKECESLWRHRNALEASGIAAMRLMDWIGVPMRTMYVTIRRMARTIVTNW